MINTIKSYSFGLTSQRQWVLFSTFNVGLFLIATFDMWTALPIYAYTQESIDLLGTEALGLPDGYSVTADKQKVISTQFLQALVSSALIQVTLSLIIHAISKIIGSGIFKVSVAGCARTLHFVLSTLWLLCCGVIWLGSQVVTS